MQCSVWWCALFNENTGNWNDIGFVTITVMYSSERVELKPACSTALNVKWKHQLGCITVYILWIGITCLMKPVHSKVYCREKERENRWKRNIDWGGERKDWASGGGKRREKKKKWGKDEAEQWDWRGWPKKPWTVSHMLKKSISSHETTTVRNMAPVIVCAEMYNKLMCCLFPCI